MSVFVNQATMALAMIKNSGWVLCSLLFSITNIYPQSPAAGDHLIDKAWVCFDSFSVIEKGNFLKSKAKLAEMYLDSSIYWGIQAEDVEILAMTAIAKANLYIQLENYSKARGFLSYVRELPDLPREDYEDVWGNYYEYLGFIKKQKREFKEALDYYEKAERTYLAGEERIRKKYLPELLNKKGNVLKNLGDTLASYSMYRKALSIKDTNYIKSNFAQAFQEFKNYDSALYYQEAILGEISKELLVDNFQYFNNIGVTYTKTAQVEKAKEVFTKALICAQNNSSMQASTLNNMGFLSFRQYNDYEQALNLFQDAFQKLLPSTEIKMKSPPLDSLSNFKQLISLKGIGISLFRLGLKKNDLTLLTSALENFQLAKALLRKLRLKQQNEQDKTSLAKHSPPIYEEAISLCKILFEKTADSTYLEIAFEFIQANKSASLFEKQLDNYVQSVSGIPPELSERERMITENLNEIRILLSTAKEPQYSQLKEKEFSLITENKKLNAILQQNYKDYHALKYGASIPSIKEVQENLCKDRRMVMEYFVGDTSIYLFLISKDHFSLNRLEVEVSQLQSEVLAFRNNLDVKATDIQVYKQTAHRLFQHLLSPVWNEVNGKKLLIMPDAFLHHLPFEALLSRETAAESYRDLPYVLFDLAGCSYARSSALQLLDRDRGAKLKDKSMSILGISPEFRVSPQDPKYSIANPYWDSVYRELGSLVKSKQMFEQNISTWGGEMLVGSEANRNNIEAHANQHRILVFGTHGKLNDQNPMRSWLALNPDKQVDSLPPFLFASDLYGMDLDTDLAILMACESGLGHLQKGEGSISMARAFSIAGVPSVVMSLWKIPDNPSNELVRRFLDKVVVGMPKDQALFEAKKEMLSMDLAHLGTYQNPKSWAGMVLIGSVENIEPSSWRRNVYVWGFLGLLFLLSMLFWKFRIRN